MGRSVIPHPEADVVAYQTFGPDEDYYRQGFAEYAEEGWVDPEVDDFEDWMYGIWNDGDSQYAWESLVEWVQERLVELFPSMYATDRDIRTRYWNTENTVIAQNAHSEVSISEYSGLVAISLAPRSDVDDYGNEDLRILSLGRAWRKKNADKFLDSFGDLERLGRGSNGEEFFVTKGNTER